ncbi:hypothetical protein LOAG_04832 [Loa loa]|uniref:Uncharacterized protein n=1 Tax=Loa loa TaxID=7209 RepID=A0A1S0U1K3_LOALO|nr:hypothetical protein LOAG_04832 [Loa loa]EFO23657.1 hypothetical protein LOAG_04832 [Loa loa]
MYRGISLIFLYHSLTEDSHTTLVSSIIDTIIPPQVLNNLDRITVGTRNSYLNDIHIVKPVVPRIFFNSSLYSFYLSYFYLVRVFPLLLERNSRMFIDAS